MTEQELRYASKEDQEFFTGCIKGLPGIEGSSGDGLDSNGEPMPHSVGAHSVRCFREIVEIVKPKNILEIGFNCGYSSALWLRLTDAKVFANDISTRRETQAARDHLYSLYDDRIMLFICDSAELYAKWPSTLEKQDFDMAFIDGGHLEHHVMADIDLCLKLGIKWLAFDDWLIQFGPGVQPAIAKHPQLEQVKIMGNIALYRNTEVE